MKQFKTRLLIGGSLFALVFGATVIYANSPHYDHLVPLWGFYLLIGILALRKPNEA